MNKTKWGVILSYVSLAVSLLGSFFISNRILNLIGDHNYGLYSFANSITSWITVISGALTASYLRFASFENKKDENGLPRINTLYIKMLSIISIASLIIGCSVFLILFSLDVPFLDYSSEDSHLLYLVLAFSIMSISASLPSTVFSLYVNFKKEFVFEKIIGILSNILLLAANFIIAFFTRNIIYISVFSIIHVLFLGLSNYIYCRTRLNIQFCKASFSANRELVHSILLFSSILILNSVVDQINSQVDKTLLGIFSTPENVTLYQMGQGFNAYLSLVSISISGVFAPRIHELNADNKKTEINNLFLRVSKLQLIVVCFVSFGFVTAGKDFIIWWIGDQRVTSYYVGAVLMVLYIMPLSVKLSIDIQRAYNKHLFRSIVFFSVAIINVLLSILFLNIFPSEYAIFACLAGTVISFVACQWIAMNIYNRRIIGLPIGTHLIQMAKQFAFGIIGFVIVFVLSIVFFDSFEHPLLRFLLKGISFSMIYIFLLLLFERKFLFSFAKKTKT